MNNPYYESIGLTTIEAAAPKIDNKSRINKRHSKPSQNYGWRTKMFGGEYNPDKLNYRDYDKMLKDPQIEAASLIVQYFLLSKKFTITPAEDTPEAKEVADFVRENLHTIKMRQIRKDMYTCIDYGYAVGELLFDYDEKQSKVILKDIIPLDIKTIQNCFEYDDYSNVKTVWQSYVDGGPVEVPAWKCLITTFNERFRNKYGKAKLKTLYDPWFMRDKVLMWLMGFLEKTEGPTTVGIAGDESNTEQMQANMDSIRDGRTSFTGKKGEQYQLLESQHHGEGYFTTLNYLDSLIFRAFFIGSLLLGQAAASGSYAQSQTHLDVTKTIFDGIHEDFAVNIQEKLNLLVDFNFHVEKYPKFSFEAFTRKDLLELLSALQPYVEKFIINEDPVRQVIKQLLKQYGDIEVSEDDLNPNSNNQQQFPQPTPEDLEENLQGMDQILELTNPADLTK